MYVHPPTARLCFFLPAPFCAAWNASAIVEDDPILTTFGNEVGVHVESMGKFSYQKAFRLRNDLKTFPIHTAVITVDEGKVGKGERATVFGGWGCRTGGGGRRVTQRQKRWNSKENNKGGREVCSCERADREGGGRERTADDS